MSFNIKTLFLILLFTLFFASCSKDNRFDCVKRSGPIVNELRNLSSFNTIETHNNLEIYLIQDTINSVEIEAGKNLVHNISTEITNEKLVIKNKNTCNFTRSYKHKIKIIVHFKKLEELIYKGTGPITSMNTIVADVFTFNSWDGVDTVKLNVKANTVYANIHTGVADLIVQGECNDCYAYAQNSGSLRLQNLKSKYVFANSISSSDMYVWAENKLDALIQYVGNIYYKGNPAEISKTENNKGKLFAN